MDSITSACIQQSIAGRTARSLPVTLVKCQIGPAVLPQLLLPRRDHAVTACCPVGVRKCRHSLRTRYRPACRDGGAPLFCIPLIFRSLGADRLLPEAGSAEARFRGCLSASSLGRLASKLHQRFLDADDLVRAEQQVAMPAFGCGGKARKTVFLHGRLAWR